MRSLDRKCSPELIKTGKHESVLMDIFAGYHPLIVVLKNDNFMYGDLTF
jgi:hypothetical protein